MPPEEDLKKRVARKLTKRRKEGHQVTMVLPERFRDGDDADEDCTAPPDSKAYMNQSVFGMIAAAGSQVDFNARFDAQSSDEEEESGEPSPRNSEKDLQVPKSRQDRPAGKSEKHKRKFSDHKLLRSITGLGSKSKSKFPPKNGSPARESVSESHTPELQFGRTSSHRDAPVMRRMLEAKAELSMRPSFDMKRPSLDRRDTDDNGESSSSSLAKRLKDIFEFEKAEDVIEGMVQWLSGGLNADLHRIPLLVAEERLAAGIYVHYNKAHMFLRIPTQEICEYC
jgi:sterol 3beta-glucosyltransferase